MPACGRGRRGHDGPGFCQTLPEGCQARISHVNPSEPVESGPKSFNVQALCVLQSKSSRYHGIERQWDVVTFDIAGLAALRTHLSRNGLA